MSVETLCQICEDARASHRCNRCGAMVCDRHYEREHGMCLDCASRADPGSRDGDTYQY
ncbi:hypothetical protein [Haloarchaeobius sp. FL176]|uniref:hypothetical protein n=1 Tax=Haloarchaeobius sp. FL176 TaxID=2967129 RepID=UPI002147B491|nr:hypothetical protein [Haloarchaeobius sp. FL176]